MKTRLQRTITRLATGLAAGLFWGLLALGLATGVQAADLAENDGFTGTMWLQTSVEFKANALQPIAWPACSWMRPLPTNPGPPCLASRWAITWPSRRQLS